MLDQWLERKTVRFAAVLALVLALLLSGHGAALAAGSPSTLFIPAVQNTPLTATAAAGQDAPGAVFTLSNAAGGNAVVVFSRGGDGTLAPGQAYPTGGLGTGASLGSQGAVVVSDDHQLLFAVNAGSNSITSFRIRPGQSLEWADTEASGGLRPTSIAYHDGLLYVLNTGTPNNVSGFTVAGNGDLTPLAGSARPLSGDATSPAQVAFDDTGSVVIVTERAPNQILTYTVDAAGYLSGPTAYPSAGPVPYGFAVTKRNTLLVSEAGPGGGASSYRIGSDGSLTPVSPHLVTGQTAACWTVVTKNGRFGYVANAATSNLSGFALGQDGSATLLNADGVTGVTGGNPTDIAVSHNSRYLYVLVNANQAIAVFTINADGSLTPQPALTGTPGGFAGLAAY